MQLLHDVLNGMSKSCFLSFQFPSNNNFYVYNDFLFSQNIKSVKMQRIKTKRDDFFQLKLFSWDFYQRANFSTVRSVHILKSLNFKRMTQRRNLKNGEITVCGKSKE